MLKKVFHLYISVQICIEFFYKSSVIKRQLEISVKEDVW